MSDGMSEAPTFDQGNKRLASLWCQQLAVGQTSGHTTDAGVEHHDPDSHRTCECTASDFATTCDQSNAVPQHGLLTTQRWPRHASTLFLRLALRLVGGIELSCAHGITAGPTSTGCSGRPSFS